MAHLLALFTGVRGETVRKGVRATLKAWVRLLYRAKTGPHEASQRLVRPHFGHLWDFSDGLGRVILRSSQARRSPKLRRPFF